MNTDRNSLWLMLPVLLIAVLFAWTDHARCEDFILPASDQQWLDAHNNYRTTHGVPSVTWSSTVAASAQAWANTCPAGHSPRPPRTYGENIAYATYTQAAQNVTTRWYDEEPLYDYNNPGFSSATGHFTQVVWKNTTQIGCGCRHDCSGTWQSVCVCQYNPPGNIIGQFAANVLPPSSTKPGAPTLASPADGAAVAGTSVTFSWNTPSGSPSKYHLQISTSSTFSSFFYNKDDRTGNSVTLSLFPNNGTRYYWRVRAYNSAGWGAWSSSRSFINGLALPDKPTLISPANHAKLTNSTVTFKWNAAARATMYWLAVANNLSASGSEMLFWGNVGNVTQYTLTLPRDGRKYYWKVTAGNSAGWGPWSNYNTLTAPSPFNPGVLMLLLED